MCVRCAPSAHIRRRVTSFDTEYIWSNVKFRKEILFRKINKWFFSAELLCIFQLYFPSISLCLHLPFPVNIPCRRKESHTTELQDRRREMFRTKQTSALDGTVDCEKKPHVQAWGSKSSLDHPQINSAKYFRFILRYLSVKKQEHKNLLTDFRERAIMESVTELRWQIPFIKSNENNSHFTHEDLNVSLPESWTIYRVLC